ncbi:hypothetical protein PV326_000658, partial [Microctonus aethiopoides]
ILENHECEDDDKYSSGSQYEPSDTEDSESSDDENHESGKMDKSRTTNNSYILRDISLILNASFNVPGSSACDDSNMKAQLSRGAKGDKKLNYCLYCQKPYTKITRHLESVHRDEEAVKKIKALAVNSDERKYEISLFRKKSNHYFNVKVEINNGELILTRRPRTDAQATGNNFTTCPICLGTYTKNNIRHHYTKCKRDVHTARGVLTKARHVVRRIHSCASKVMREEVLPRMLKDNIVRLIRYDFLIIKFGNKLCREHRKKCHHKMIRAKLRLMGRFVQTLQTILPEITDFVSTYNGNYFDKILEAIDIVAELDHKNGTYGKASVAGELGTNIKKIGKLLDTEYSKSQERDKEELVQNFLKIYDQEFTGS